MATPNRRRTYRDLLHSAKKHKPNSSPLSSPCSSPMSSPVVSPRMKRSLFDDSELNVQHHIDSLSSLPLTSLGINSSHEVITLVLLSKFGMKFMNHLALAIDRVPANFPNRNMYVSNIVNHDNNSSINQSDAGLLCKLLSSCSKDVRDFFCLDNSYRNQHLWNCSITYKEPYTAFLVPPVTKCIHQNCSGVIYFHHKSSITLHTLEGPVPAQKAIYRCRECSCLYNLESYSSPKEGTRFYPFQTQWRAASNRVYFSKELHEFLCEAG